MQIEINFINEKKHPTLTSTPRDALLETHVGMMDSDGCKSVLTKIQLTRKGGDFNLQTEISCAKNIGPTIKIRSMFDAEDYPQYSMINLSIDEYERLITLWMNFLSSKHNLSTHITLHDSSVLEDEAIRRYKKAKAIDKKINRNTYQNKDGQWVNDFSAKIFDPIKGWINNTSTKKIDPWKMIYEGRDPNAEV